MPSFKMQTAIILLFFIGIINVLNSISANMVNAEKSSWLPAYINTHLITSIIIFAAWANLQLIPGDFFSEVFLRFES